MSRCSARLMVKILFYISTIKYVIVDLNLSTKVMIMFLRKESLEHNNCERKIDERDK